MHFDPANARKHSERNLDAIKGSLAKFGQRKPIVVDRRGRILAGNGTIRRRASHQLRRFVEAWRGIRSMRKELDSGRIRLEGRKNLQRSFPDWLLLSALAHLGRQRSGRERTTCTRYNQTK